MRNLDKYMKHCIGFTWRFLQEKKKAISGQHVALEVDFSMNISSLPSSWLFLLDFLIFFAQRCWLFSLAWPYMGFKTIPSSFYTVSWIMLGKGAFKTMLKYCYF